MNSVYKTLDDSVVGGFPSSYALRLKCSSIFQVDIRNFDFQIAKCAALEALNELLKLYS